jgi:hypothetical protein
MLPHRTLLSVPLECTQNPFFSHQWRSIEQNRPLRFVAHRPTGCCFNDMTSLDAAYVEATVMSALCEESARSNGMRSAV